MYKLICICYKMHVCVHLCMFMYTCIYGKYGSTYTYLYNAYTSSCIWKRIWLDNFEMFTFLNCSFPTSINNAFVVPLLIENGCYFSLVNWDSLPYCGSFVLLLAGPGHFECHKGWVPIEAHNTGVDGRHHQEACDREGRCCQQQDWVPEHVKGPTTTRLVLWKG